jgi:hypothetical protein
MIQVSLVGYAVGGAFLNLAQYDAPYNLLTALVLTRILVEKEIKGADHKEEVPMRPQMSAGQTAGHEAASNTRFGSQISTDKNRWY